MQRRFHGPAFKRRLVGLFLVTAAVVTTTMTAVKAWETCSVEQGGGICPEGNTCCRLVLDDDDDDDDKRQMASSSISSGCIASDMGRRNATCCLDDEMTYDAATTSRTGCPVGYTCQRRRRRTANGATNNETTAVCVAPPHHRDPLTRTIPRYRLCQAEEIRTVHELSLITTTTTLGGETSSAAGLAYYSSHGPIEDLRTVTIQMALIFIHGADRNGDDYLCSAKATVELQHRFQKENVLVIAPIFYGTNDATRPADRPSLLYWDVSEDSDGPWRYGADASGPVSVSSFAALDALVNAVRTHLQELELVTIAGHSSGGQTVQRWSLLTSNKVWPPSDNHRIRAVVANPSSYVYLTPLRWIDGCWRVPDSTIVSTGGNNRGHKKCPGYDQWEWGLESGGVLDVPYRNAVLSDANATIAVLERFKNRQVVTLAGGRDLCNVSSSTPAADRWCDSHGLEMTCMDELQGSNRLERSARYMASLGELGFSKHRQRRVVVPHVGHDHSLMFQSQKAIEVLYGTGNLLPREVKLGAKTTTEKSSQ